MFYYEPKEKKYMHMGNNHGSVSLWRFLLVSRKGYLISHGMRALGHFSKRNNSQHGT